ncbi:hypothetical protein [Mycobacteroides abscessus]|uniref:hypothetical protein n=1 Tax=Mycobacteroides abscessus TaxID=36809 RepID=UPI000386851C|nr:hypothetical protein [Mycobacteroides abscessus]EPZ18808.1 hypothetical protein M879_19580 [Mycobacteroides abscessus V06705]MDO3267834.1 hypothetical protein [Mycobacteroides abscessus subsp. abscessus]
MDLHITEGAARRCREGTRLRFGELVRLASIGDPLSCPIDLQCELELGHPQLHASYLQDDRDHGHGKRGQWWIHWNERERCIACIDPCPIERDTETPCFLAVEHPGAHTFAISDENNDDAGREVRMQEAIAAAGLTPARAAELLGNLIDSPIASKDLSGLAMAPALVLAGLLDILARDARNSSTR